MHRYSFREDHLFGQEVTDTGAYHNPTPRAFKFQQMSLKQVSEHEGIIKEEINGHMETVIGTTLLKAPEN